MDVDTLTLGRAEITDTLEAVQAAMPIQFTGFTPWKEPTGLVVVDEVNGFCTVGCGPMAPMGPNEQIDRMVQETDRLARAFDERHRPVLAFLDTHEPGRPEPPYPPHCERGTGHEDLVPTLKWLEDSAHTTLIRKNCINGFVGAIGRDNRNRVVDWVNANRLNHVLVVGICTDICVMDFVLTMLSARNHGLMPTLREVAVYEPGCATYDLPAEAAAAAGLPPTAAHPQAIAHHMGLYFMAARGALLADRLA
ncbi:MAG TPA: isochorismatase family protein [Azospirillaceae bacterium]|nr:isochorismatase family protein [Azospirillaceae bacterium]